MPFTDADHNPITCHTCPFKIGVDCTAMPQIPYTNQHGMQRWTYPPALNPCLRHPALGITKLPEGVTAVLGMPTDIVQELSADAYKDITDDVQDRLLENILALQRSGRLADGGIVPTPQPISDDIPVPPEIDPGIVGAPGQRGSRTRASRATARPAE